MIWHILVALILIIPPTAVFIDQFSKGHLGLPGMNMFGPWTFKLLGHSFTIPPYFFKTGNARLDILLGRNDLIHCLIGFFFGYALLFFVYPIMAALHIHNAFAITILGSMVVSIACFLTIEIHEHDVRWDNTTAHSVGTILAIIVQLLFPFYLF